MVSRDSSIAARVYATLHEAIVSIDLAPGEAISEKEIADRLGTSRTPAREALIRLVSEGLVEVVPQVGTFIAKIDLAEVAESIFIRVAIESAATRDAAALSSPAALGAMRAVLETQALAIEGKDFPTFVRTDAEFHHEAFLAGGHGRAWNVVQGVRHHMDRVRMLHRELYDGPDGGIPEGTTMKGSYAQHRRILKAIEARDEVAAMAETEDHVRSMLATAPLIALRRPELFVSPPSESEGWSRRG